jgi:CHAT domain
MYSGTLNLDARIAPAGSGYEVTSSGPEVGEATEPFALPFTNDELRATVDQLAAIAVDGRVSPAARMALESVGRRLFEALFSGEVYASFRRLLDVAGRDGKRLRIRLRIAAPELIDLPWELLYFPARKVYLAADRGTPLVRYLELPDPAPPLPIQLPLEVLAVAPRTSDMPELDVAGEQRKLETALRPLITAGEVRLRWTSEGTISGLARTLDEGPVHVLHYIGHGGWDPGSQTGLLYFEASVDDRQSLAAPADTVAAAIRSHPSLRLVVLNACEGARAGPPFSGTSQAMVKAGIPAVVAMQFPITDEAAIAFSGELYHALAGAEPVDVAVATARRGMLLGGNDVEWATPVVYLRSDDGRLFDRGAAATPGPVAPEVVTIATGEVVARNESPDGVRVDRAAAPAAMRRRPVRRPPADFPDLLGRDADVQAARTRLAADSFGVYGERGVGKSSLLRYLANRLPAADEDFVHIRAVGRPLDDIAQGLFEEFYLESEPPLRPSEARLHSYLGAIEGLVVLDDVELPSDDLDALLDSAPNCRFLIASSSQRLTGPGRSHLLHGLAEDAAAELIARDLGRPLTSAETEDASAIGQAHNGKPGAILQAVAPVREGRARLADVRGGLGSAPVAAAPVIPTDAVTSRVKGLLGPLGAAPLSAEHIVALVGPGVEVDTLQARAVIKANSPRYTLVTDAGAFHAAPTDPALYELLPHLAGWAESHRSKPDRLAEDAEAIVAALRWGVTAERWGEVLRLARAVEDALFATRRWGQWRIVLELAMAAATQLGDELEMARIRHQRGTRLLALGDAEGARAELSTALDARVALEAFDAAWLTRHNITQILPPSSGPDDEPGSPDDEPGQQGDVTQPWDDPVERRGWNDGPPPPGRPWLAIAVGLAVVAALIVGVGIATGVIPPRDPARLEVDVASLDFGELEVGQISQQQSIEIKNTGGRPASSIAIALEPFADDFTFSSNCSRELAPAESCRVRVDFRPQLAGPRETTLAITSGTVDEGRSVSLRGAGTAPPGVAAAEIRPNELDFGEARIGEAGPTQTLALLSRGETQLEVLRVAEPGGPFRIVENSCDAARLDIDLECVIRIAFEPDSLGVSNGVLSIETNAPGSPHQVALLGTGTGDAHLVLPDTIDLGDAAPGQSVSRDLSVGNDGTAPLTIQSVRIVGESSPLPEAPSSNQFTISSDGCSGGTIESGTDCTIGLTFAPSQLGPQRATIEILHDVADEPSTIPLTGRGFDGDPNLAGKAAIANLGEFDYVDEDGDGYFDVDVVVSISNVEVGTAGTFKIAMRFRSSDEEVEVQFVPREGEPLASEDGYVFTTRNLPGGGLMEFRGEVLISNDFEGNGGTILIALDSCVGEEVEDPRCRVPETNEDDNLLEVRVPSRVD